MNISVPKGFVEKVKEFAPNGNVSKFIVDSVEEKMRHKDRLKALRELKELGPAFPHIKDSVKWVNKLREADERRMERLGLGLKDIKAGSK